MVETPKPHRRHFQYSLRSLFVVMFLACVGMSWVGVKMQTARRQREAVEAIKKLGGSVAYDYEIDASGNFLRGPEAPELTPPGPKHLRNLIGDDFYSDVVFVNIPNAQVMEGDLEQLEGLPQLRILELIGTNVTDMELRHLKGLTRLEKLWLNRTQVTGVGLQNLKGLTKLHTLRLDDTQVKDTELEHLKGLTQLRFLSLGTNITANGREELQRALPDCTICGPMVPQP
jgi:Leucine-rich repeat (LRR) protein